MEPGRVATTHPKPKDIFMRVLVCGGRNYGDNETLYAELRDLELVAGDTIVHGGANGADAWAGKFARGNGLIEEVHPAKWKTHGRTAGFIRNQEMLDSGIDFALVFPGGNGTEDMMCRLFRDGIRFLFIGTDRATQA